MERAPVPWPGQRWGPGRPPASLQGSTSFPKTDYEFGASRLERSVRETVSLAGPLRGRGRMLVKIATILNRFCRYYRQNCSRGLLLSQIGYEFGASRLERGLVISRNFWSLFSLGPSVARVGLMFPLEFLPSALNVCVKRFVQARVNGGSNYDSLKVAKCLVI